MEKIDSDIVKAEKLRQELERRFSIVTLYTGSKYRTRTKKSVVIVDKKVTHIVRKKKILRYTKTTEILMNPIMKYKVGSRGLESFTKDEHELKAIEEFGDDHKIKFLYNMVI
jgi:hypothetical protein